MFPFLSQMNLINMISPCFLKALFSIFFFHWCLGIPSGLFLPGFPTKTFVCVSHLSHMHAMCPTNLILLDLIIVIFGEEYKLWTFSLCNFLQPPPSSYVHIFFPPPFFSDTLNLCSSLNVSDQVLHPGWIIVLHNLIFMFLDDRKTSSACVVLWTE